MKLVEVFFFIFAVHISGIEGARYDIDDPAGIVSIVLLALAIIVCILSLVMFFYIVYKLWNGNFRHHRYYGNSNISRQKIVAVHDHETDGIQETSLNTKPIYSYHNEVAAAEEAREAEMEAVVETDVVKESFKTEEVIVSQAPPTEQAEMETQELVVVFDDNDDVIDVLTHVA
ncbi:uncharacterized protein LOC114540732 [Dendronephthya gigantea]|uniref:uncharacterized protein LOC114540732 n=1 Tax=Dendronephthya gigantea TaxID=151771 RepID=UPI001069A05D|nr:uncharacterized protein LOC114540732 [Dendronephthya gigantea]